MVVRALFDNPPYSRQWGSSSNKHITTFPAGRGHFSVVFTELTGARKRDLCPGANYCYCAYVLRISRYSGFLWVAPSNTGIILRLQEVIVHISDKLLALGELTALRGLIPVVQTLSKCSLDGDSGNECLTRSIEQKGYQKSPKCKAIFLVWETLNLHPKTPVQTSSTSCFHEKLCN